jgi:hypothetical protein
MRNVLVAWFVVAAALSCAPSDRAVAQPTILSPMSVENYRLMQRVSRNGGWGATAYRNYLIGLFEGLLVSEGDTAGDRHGRLFCLPPERGRSTSDTFEWMENELNNVVAKAPPNTYVVRIFVAHLTTSYPCQG